MRLFTRSRFFSLLFFLFVFQNFYAQTAAEEAQEMLDLVNELRANNGVSQLVLNDRLNIAAYDHSDDMARNDYFSHTGLNGSSFSQRVIDNVLILGKIDKYFRAYIISDDSYPVALSHPVHKLV